MQLDLTKLSWHLVGWTPNAPAWLQGSGHDPSDPQGDFRMNQCTPLIPTVVPGSVQDDLVRAGLLPDWNVGLNPPLCEWVEHRQWEYRTTVEIPTTWQGQRIILRAEGLDYSGEVWVNGKTVARFTGMLTPHEFDLTSALKPGSEAHLSILFDQVPHEQGQIGFTSRSHYFKARFAYSWDWCPRLVPIGIWDGLTLMAVGEARLQGCLPYAHYDLATGQGQLSFRLDVETPQPAALNVRVRVQEGAAVLAEQVLPCAFSAPRGETLLALPRALTVKPWWPNGLGDQPLYDVTVQLETRTGEALDSWAGKVGFRHVRWLPCEGASANAEPWICEVNGKAIFLQGINWVPVRMTYGSVTREMYAQRLELYADMGLNILRVWGGAVLEKEDFFQLCDELGLMVWQEFPLSSSGANNTPPDGPQELADLGAICTSYIWRRGAHASQIIWCGGNELTTPDGRPVNESHPAIALMAAISARLAPDKRFLSTSSSGPSFGLDPKLLGLGLHHDVHGPWKMPGTFEEWQAHWDQHDALFVSEVGAPSCSSVEILKRFQGDLALWPPAMDNPAWHDRDSWWVEWEAMKAEHGFSEAHDELERYVALTQERQAQALGYLAASLKRRFPRCGGVIIWMGHDCYPCPSNTSIVDFDGNPKPAVAALRQIFHE